MFKLAIGLLMTLAVVLMSPLVVQAPECPQAEVKAAEVSRGEPELRIEHRVMRVTAYTKNDPGMDERGITTSEAQVLEGVTIAAPPEIPIGTQINIPALDRTYTVTDRGGAIKGNRLDLYMEKRTDALEFGVQELEVWIRY